MVQVGVVGVDVVNMGVAGVDVVNMGVVDVYDKATLSY